MKTLRSVLIVDDSEVDSFMAERILKRVIPGAQICRVINGQDALALFQTCEACGRPSPDLVLLDINMPLMNGFEFLEAYEQFVVPTQRFPTPVVMFTSSNDAGDRKRALSHRCVKEYVVKPLSVAAAGALVERFGIEL